MKKKNQFELRIIDVRKNRENMNVYAIKNLPPKVSRIKSPEKNLLKSAMKHISPSFENQNLNKKKYLLYDYFYAR